MTDSAGRPGETEAVEAVHRATCHVPNCVARFDAEVAVDAAYPIIAEAVRAEALGAIDEKFLHAALLDAAFGSVIPDADSSEAYRQLADGLVVAIGLRLIRGAS